MAGKSCAWLTTPRPDGSPHTTPVWFVLHNDTFWVASSARNVKVRSLDTDSRVAVAIDGSGSEPQVAQVRAFVHEDIAPFTHVVSFLAEKYRGWNVADESVDGRRVLIEISVDRWLLGGEPREEVAR
jgi:PPOX class probable F420-dependent enzyme